MTNIFGHFAGGRRLGRVTLETVFDAEAGSPELIDAMAANVPAIRDLMASLRQSLPLVPHSGVGSVGSFFRLPNHYRSTCFIIPSARPGGQAGPGVVVFKGTEPLLADFPAYLDWMLGVPFRGSSLPLGLHFPLEMRLPPAAMWIQECMAEQAVSSRLQQRYLKRHGRVARLPVPLFVFKLMPEQMARYEAMVRDRISKDAFARISGKLVEGLGVEVYYYPELPVRVADLFVGNLRDSFRDALSPEQIQETFGAWAGLLGDLLCLGYMPYAPWHHGMGGCLDQGNACIDGGFNDLLTLVPFDAIPNDALFRSCMLASIRMLGDTMVALAAASIGSSSQKDSDAGALAATYVTENLREHVRESVRCGDDLDARLVRFFDVPHASHILQFVTAMHQSRNRLAQFIADEHPNPNSMLTPELAAGVGI